MFAQPTVDRPRIPSGYGVPRDTKNLLPWSHVEQRLKDAKVFWIATIGPRGRPHVRPVDGLYLDGKIYVGGSPETRWVRNVSTNPEVSITLDGGYDVVIVEGVVETLTPDRELAERLAAASKAKYPEYGMKPGDYERPGVLAARPRVAYAWKAFPKDVTRFRFEGSGSEA
jgi:nitroimidazol reductase NimA-like FMN-containing flavoprotein (pyridoxamine 5'-phosphate oxidase superfamily)